MRSSMVVVLAACFSGLALNTFAAEKSIRFHTGPEAAKQNARAENLPIVLYCLRKNPNGETATSEQLQEIAKSKVFTQQFDGRSKDRKKQESRLAGKAVFFRQLIPADSESFGGKLISKHDLKKFPGALVFDLKGDDLMLRGTVNGSDKNFDEFVKSLEEVLDKKPDVDQGKQ